MWQAFSRNSSFLEQLLNGLNITLQQVAWRRKPMLLRDLPWCKASKRIRVEQNFTVDNRYLQAWYRHCIPKSCKQQHASVRSRSRLVAPPKWFEYFTAASCMVPETNVALRLAVVQSVKTHQNGAELHCKYLQAWYGHYILYAPHYNPLIEVQKRFFNGLFFLKILARAVSNQKLFMMAGLGYASSRQYGKTKTWLNS